MKRYIIVIGLVILSAFGLLISDRVSDPATEGKITGFSANDIPFDDGTGIMLKWKPLHKSNRIIQYNVYRGVHPDSLFFLSHLEVDPKMGVLSDELFFYDKDYPTLIDFETAPGKLKREKQQTPDSPLFRGVPRDPSVLAKLIDRYSVLGVISSNAFYKHSKKIVSADSSFAAGLKVNQFEYLLANVLPQQKYYYTVLGVNERGQLLPFADVQEVSPVDNRPDPTAISHPVMLTDKNELRLEWGPPNAASDIYMWEGWLMPKSNLAAFEQAQLADKDADPTQDSSPLWKGGAVQVFQSPNQYLSTNYYETVSLPAGIAVENYSFVLGYMDYNGFYAYSLGRPIATALSTNLPTLPGFEVLDKRNDKGDNLLISIGKPIVFITQASYANQKHNRLRINYELADNEAYDVDRIRFVFSADGQDLGTVYEYFLDQIIHLKIPQGRKLEDITVKIAVKTNKDKDFGEELIQHVEYDQANRRFSGNRMELAGQRLNKLYYDLMIANRLNPIFTPGNRMGGLSRSYDHSIAYEDMLYKGLSGYDSKTRRFKLDPFVVVAADTATGAPISVPLYKDEWTKQIVELKDTIKQLEASVATATEPSVKDSLSAVLAQNQMLIDFATKHPVALKADNRGGYRWLKTFLAERDLNSRSQAYQLIATNGKGLYQISEPYTKDGSQWFYPKNEWFDDTKWITLIGSIILILLVVYSIVTVRRRDPYIRPIAGLVELDNAVGRATEMGRPVMFVPGWGTLGDPCTISAMMILSQIAKKTAEFDIRLISPHVDYFVVPVAQEIVKTSYSEVGRPDSYNQNDIFFVSDVQFAFSAAVNGITIRDRVATIFYMGYFNAEALLMTETGNQTGAIQIAASDAITQIPFFITTCDYTLIGEEFYAASAYLSKNPDIVSMLKAQDYFKLLIVLVVTIGTILSTLNMTGFVNSFPVE